MKTRYEKEDFVKVLKLSLYTHNKISKKPISELNDTLSKKVDRKLSEITKLLESKKLLEIKDGSGRDAYDGYGFDFEQRNFDFFWYFANSAHGERQLVKVVSALLSLDLAFKKQDLTLRFQVYNHPF